MEEKKVEQPKKGSLSKWLWRLYFQILAFCLFGVYYYGGVDDLIETLLIGGVGAVLVFVVGAVVMVIFEVIKQSRENRREQRQLDALMANKRQKYLEAQKTARMHTVQFVSSVPPPSRN